MFSRKPQPGILRALTEVESLMAAAFRDVGTVQPGSILDQCGLRDGGDIVRNYFRHGEAHLALEHLIYMVHEPPLAITLETYELIRAEEEALGFGPSSYAYIHP